jgi:uncharacterized repeat protein (TIGR03803 family)
MPRTTSAAVVLTLALTLVVLMLPAGARAAAKEKILHEFPDEPSAASGLIFDSAGNLYGTTYYGGIGKHCASGCGTVFELMPKAGGGWTEKLLYSFLGWKVGDGQYPQAGLIFDSAGNLYGTTSVGGAYGIGNTGGIVFELSPGANGQWTEKILHSFQNNGADGSVPLAGVIFDAAGNLYGTTRAGGASGWGTVFELVPVAGGWNETVLYSFDKTSGGGVYPYAGVIFDASGNLYGTTSAGGVDYGTVYELSPPQQQGGAWTLMTIHTFGGGKDGATPLYGSLIFDTEGNLYGTTEYGGKGKVGVGTVFELSPRGDGSWTVSRSFGFPASGEDGAYPFAGLVLRPEGQLYGTTTGGGNAGGVCSGCGTVFQLTPISGGKWAETLLYKFPTNGKKGFFPDSTLVLDGNGNLYGTTEYGGLPIPHSKGVAFEVTH